MSNKKFFSISGLAVAAHTPETKKIWQSWENNDCSKSDKGRQAILKFAKDLGFQQTEDTSTEEAFYYLLKQFPDISGIKSYILRRAIIHYS